MKLQIKWKGFQRSHYFRIGKVRNTLTVRNGKIENVIVDGGPLVKKCPNTSPETYGQLLNPKPPALYNDFFALIAIGDMRFDGNIKIIFQQWFTFSNWVRAGRELQGH